MIQYLVKELNLLETTALKVYLPNRVCESHPHNFILEILNDTVFGLFLFLYQYYLYCLIFTESTLLEINEIIQYRIGYTSQLF